MRGRSQEPEGHLRTGALDGQRLQTGFWILTSSFWLLDSGFWPLAPAVNVRQSAETSEGLRDRL
jgi:hypothetical protein